MTRLGISQTLPQTIIQLAFAGVLATGAAAPAFAESQTESVTLTDIRGMRFCEFLLVYEDRVEIFNTSASAGCPEDLWAAMDTALLAEAHGAVKAQLNGPKFWAMDEQTINLGEAKTFAGIEARYGATLPLAALGGGEGADPYSPYISAKTQTMTFKAGSPVYELVDPGGNVYALNAWGPDVRDGDPANLADQLAPAEGWSFRVTTLAEDLTIEGSTEAPVDMAGDDMHQYYTRYGPAAQ